VPPSALTESASSITFSVIGELIARVILKRAVEAGKTLGRPLSPAIEKRIRDQLRAGNSVWGE
jgi:hypothetical protein